MKQRILLSVLLLVTVVVVVGCRKPADVIEVKPPYDKPLAPGQQALRKITNPHDVPDFTMACMDVHNLREAVEKSLNYLSKPSSLNYFPSGEITHDKAVASLHAFGELLDSGLQGSQLNDAIRARFDVYMSVGCDDRGTVLFTGYYTPIFEGSKTATEEFRYPLYAQPDDLVKGPDGEIFGRRMADGTDKPYPPRAVIEDSQMFRGSEVVWLNDPFEAYIAHVQGSAKIRLPDGTLTGVGYAANNGHEYRSISKQMIDDGAITRSQLSLSAMIEYFKGHAEQVRKYTRLNPRFVFFKNERGEPRGSLNEPVTPMRSIATDKSIFPRACLTYIATYLPKDTGVGIENLVYSGFALDQDAGGAIRAPGRCDVYMGQGDTAGKLAGHTYQEGKLYYLFLK